MPTRRTQPTATRMARQAQQAQVIVAACIGPDGLAVGTAKDLERWRRLTPLADWTTINLASTARSEILRSVAAVLEQKHIAAHQLILLGGGIAMRRLLELVLQGARVCAGILAIDIPRTPLQFRIMPTAAAIRLVAQGGSHSASHDLVRALQVADLDRRIITLTVGRSDARAAASAAETFILELVATVGRQACHGDRTNDIQDS
jgi:hypothetical protein